ncbi:MAG: LysR family transcriptional regulator [Verrucomicrobiales bacterium]|nr:LysR family transcriptional regulator [Verrucomicrobiales bacterium]
MDLKRLKYFVTAVRALNISRAARSLNVSQPALSRSIKDLEAEVGTELFYRNSSGISLTKAGQELLDSAEEILAIWERSMVSIQNMASGREATLEVSYVPFALEAFVGLAMATLNESHPNLAIRPYELTSHVQVDALRSGEKDVCIIAHRAEDELVEDFDVFQICEVKMAAVVSRNDEFAVQPFIRLKELTEREFISYDSQNQKYCEAMVRNLFDAEGVPYRPSMYANSCQSMIAAVCSGRGYGILPVSGYLLASEHFEFVELRSEISALKTTVSALVKKGESRESVLDLLRECRRIALANVPRLESVYAKQRGIRMGFTHGGE